MSKVLSFTCENWEKEVMVGEMPVFIDFRIHELEAYRVQNWALEKFSEDFDDVVKVGFVDVSECLGIALKHRIQDLPTLSLFQGGNILKSFTGCERVKLMEAWWISVFVREFYRASQEPIQK